MIIGEYKVNFKKENIRFIRRGEKEARNTTVFVIIRKFVSIENEGDVVKRVGIYVTRLSVIDSGTFLVGT